MMVLSGGRVDAEHHPARTRQLIRDGTQRLSDAGVSSAQREAEWLLGHLVDQKPTELYLREAPVSDEIAERFLSGIAARAAGTPLQYLIGEAEFFGERFAVAPGVFIPRPETEAVVEEAVRQFRRLERRLGRSLRLLDLGTGSGCIAVTLAGQLPTCAVVAVEVSWSVLAIAAENVRRHRRSTRVQMVCGRWMEPLRSGDVFDGIVSNPPYIPSGQVDRLPLDVRQEPRESLDGGEDGLRDLRQLLGEAPRLLRPGGAMVVECGEEQAAVIAREMAAAAWVADAQPIADLAGRPRGVAVHRRH